MVSARRSTFAFCRLSTAAAIYTAPGGRLHADAAAALYAGPPKPHCCSRCSSVLYAAAVSPRPGGPSASFASTGWAVSRPGWSFLDPLGRWRGPVGATGGPSGMGGGEPRNIFERDRSVAKTACQPMGATCPQRYSHPGRVTNAQDSQCDRLSLVLFMRCLDQPRGTRHAPTAAAVAGSQFQQGTWRGHGGPVAPPRTMRTRMAGARRRRRGQPAGPRT